MSTRNYNSFLDTALSEGLNIHKGIERRCVDGVYGMYATKKIPKLEQLVRFPLNKLLATNEGLDYPESFTKEIRYFYTCTKNISESKRPWFYFDNFYPLKDIKKSHVYFAKDSELQGIRQASPILFQYIKIAQTRINKHIEEIKSFDKNIDQDVLLTVIINSQQRSWDDVGFIPVLDLFNHSEVDGLARRVDDENAYLVAGQDLEPGDQIFINYGQKDMYFHAIDYGYFDPNSLHNIDLGLRTNFTAQTTAQKQTFRRLNSIMNLVSKENPDKSIDYNIAIGEVFLGETAPNYLAMLLFYETCFRSDQDRNNKTLHGKLIRNRAEGFITSMKSFNKIYDVISSDIPSKFIYLRKMLEKEHEILNANIAWAKQQSAGRLLR
jgi:hypothetical protein